jgi:hypothetical protein
MVACMYVFFSGNVFAQTRNETHTALTSHHQAIMSHANAISSGAAKSMNELIGHANEARQILANAKKAHSQLKKTTPGKSISSAILHYDNIDKQHASATAHANSMLAELRNANTDREKLKDHSRKLNAAIDLAEKEHMALIKDTK